MNSTTSASCSMAPDSRKSDSMGRCGVLCSTAIESWDKARTGTFFLPNELVKLIKDGKELGEADDIVFKRSNSKQENGAVGILTGDVIDRTKYYTEAVVLSLIPFKNIDLY